MLAVSSSAFIGASFIVKKKGLKRAGASGARAGAGGYSYLREPLWWAGLAAMVAGEAANFAAYAYAPAVLVTPLGALSILVSAVLAHWLLHERLNVFGAVGCVLCVAGSLAIVLHAPLERPVASVLEMWRLATAPAFLLYAACALAATLYLVFRVPPEVAATNVLVYVAICSAVGSLSVMACKALGVALKLALRGDGAQLRHPAAWAFAAVVGASVVTQMNYLNKALDLFNTAVVTPIYYVMFTTLTIAASTAMFGESQGAAEVLTQLSGFVTIVCGTFLLHATRELDVSAADLGGLLGLRGLRPPASASGGGGGGGGDEEMAPLAGRGPGAAQLRKMLRAASSGEDALGDGGGRPR